MHKPKYPWPDTAASRGTLFFVQAVRAFLDQDSYEGFRAYALDTLARVREALAVIADVDAKRVKRPALKPITDELIWSIRHDKAFIAIMPDKIALVLVMLADQSVSLATLSSLLRMIETQAERVYREKLIENVVALIETNKKGDLLTATGYLLSHLVNEGHSAEHVLWELNKRFWQNPVARGGPSVVRTFLGGITKGKQAYTVTFGVSNPTKTLLLKLGSFNVVSREDLPVHAQDQAVEWMPNYEWFIHERSIAADPYQAAMSTHRRLDDVKALMILPAQRLDVSWSKNSYVSKLKAQGGVALAWQDTPLLALAKRNPVGRKLRQFTSVPNAIDKWFDQRSIEQIKNAISTAAIAFDSTRAEARLISLWSAFEILLGDPPEEGARIAHFVPKVLPCISLKYHRRLFSAVLDQLVASYGKRVNSIVASIEAPETSNQHTRFAKLVALDRYKEQQAALTSLAKDNPLALYRLYRLQAMYGKPADAVKTIVSHEERVQWQLHRIYRARNNLVHAGRPPIFIDAIIKNAVEYFRSALTTVVKIAENRGCTSDIDQVIAEAYFESLSMRDALRGAGNLPFSETLAQRTFCAL